MTTTPQPRLDTIEARRAALNAVVTPHEPTQYLSPSERTYFDFLVESREHSTWTKMDLDQVCEVAKMRETRLMLEFRLAIEGYTITTHTGAVKVNPVQQIVANLNMEIDRKMKRLGLSASQRALTGHHQANRNAAEREAREVVERNRRSKSSDLLAP